MCWGCFVDRKVSHRFHSFDQNSILDFAENTSIKIFYLRLSGCSCRNWVWYWNRRRFAIIFLAIVQNKRTLFYSYPKTKKKNTFGTWRGCWRNGSRGTDFHVDVDKGRNAQDTMRFSICRAAKGRATQKESKPNSIPKGNYSHHPRFPRQS